jgi:hypothetical protein
MADEKNREQQSGKQKEQSQQKQNNPFSEQEKHGDEQQRRAPGTEREYQGDQSRQRRDPGVEQDGHKNGWKGREVVALAPAPPTVANALLPPPR